MRMFLRAVLAFSAVCLLQAVSVAATLMVAGSGMFSASAPTTTYSAASTAWSFSFNVSSTPAVTNADSMGFDVPFSNFTYTLGVTNVVTTPDRIRFFTGGIGGLFNIDISASSLPNDNPITGFEFTGAQAFSSTTSSPMITTGTYPASPASFWSGSSQTDPFISGATIDIAQVGAPEPGPGTPEPATLAMAAAGCCLFAWMRRRQSARQ